MPTITLSDLAQSLGATLIGDGSRSVSACNTLKDAGESDISLLHNAKYASELETTRAAGVIVAEGTAKQMRRAEGLPPLALLESKNPYHAWQQTMVKLHGHAKHATVGISSQAAIHPSAKIGNNTSIHPFAVIGENVTIGDNCHIYPHVTLLSGVQIGNDTVVYPSVTIYERCIVGSRCIINAGTVIGSDGFSYAQAGGIHHKVPQTGNVKIEDDVEICSNTIVERAALKTTTVARGTKIGNLVVVGHNCQIGPGNLLVSQVGIAGSTNTGKYVVMAGQVGVNGHLDIPDFVKIGAQAGVMTNPEPDTEIAGSPAMEVNLMKRIVLNQMRLPELAKRVKELEKQLSKLEAES